MEKDKTILDSCLGKNRNLVSLVDYSGDSIVSKTLLDKKTGTITLFAFDKGQKLSEHTSPYDATVQVLDGSASITIAGEQIKVQNSEIVIMPANVPHAVRAPDRFKMLLTMLRA